jgi:hypothetical protein
MSAQPARNITKVESYQRPDGEYRCKVTIEGGEVVSLASLSRAETLRAVKIAFPETSGKAWFTVKTEVIQHAIRTSTVPEDVAAGKTGPKAPAPKQDAPKAPVPDAEVPEAPTPPAPSPAPSGANRAAEALAEALAGLIPDAPVIDTAAVEAIVKRHVDKVLIEAPVVTVKIQGATTKELPRVSHKQLPEVVTVIGAGLGFNPLNVFLVGPAGTGKSTLAHQAANVITTKDHPERLPFHALSLGPTTPTSKLFGYNDANGVYNSTNFRKVYEFGGVFLLDELDNGHPGLVAELNQALANGYAAFADGLVKRHPDAVVVATGNTFGKGPDRLFVGRNILDAATLDRFVTIEVDYDEGLERTLALGFATPETTDQVRAYVALVQSVRKSVLRAGLPLVVSPRASIEGALLIRAGLTPERVAEIRLYAGWSSEHRVKAGV